GRGGLGACTGAGSQPARYGYGTRDREEPGNHRPRDPRRAERAGRGPGEFASEPAPRPRDAAQTGAAAPGGDTHGHADLEEDRRDAHDPGDAGWPRARATDRHDRPGAGGRPPRG